MKFQQVADIFNQIEQISGRLEITKLLSNLFSQSSPEEAKIIAYISLGSLNPPYIGTQFNFAEKNVIKVIAKLLNIDEKEVSQEAKEYGDLGSVLEHHSNNWSEPSNFTVEEIYEKLSEIEKISGTGSQEVRLDKVYELLKQLDPVSAKFIVRILTGTLRLGFSDMTIIDAISWMLVGDKSLHKEIEHAYNVCADIGYIAYIAREKGIEGIEKIEIIVGIPIRPAAAERLPTARDIIEKIGHCVAQPKFDGFRLQIHLDKRKENPVIRFFSRNLIDMSYMFPDLVQAFEKLNVETLICEGEAIAYDINTGNFVPFQETVKRKRKHGIEEMQEELPLKVFIFDVLYFNGESLMNKTHHERRDVLINTFKDHINTLQIADEKEIHTAQKLEEYFMENISSGLEGLVIKKPDSNYQPGKRNFNWIKLKRQEEGQLEDTLDCVILGYYYGEGKRAQFGIGAFLVGLYNKEKDLFQTVAKIGTGLKDEQWIELKKKCDKIHVPHQPNNVECNKDLYPDVWVNPEIVVLVRADEITLSPVHSAGKTAKQPGFALRFPRFMGYRPDKKATDSTSIDELHRLYEDQFKKRSGK